MSSLASSVKWLKKDFRGAFMHSKAALLGFEVTVYTIWRLRNDVIFAGKSSNVGTTFKNIQFLVYSVLNGLYPWRLSSFR